MQVPLAPPESIKNLSPVEIRPSPNNFYDRYREDITINESERVISLPRGGKIVRTAAGDIQFGMPPETIKDSMKLGLTVPNNFVILGEMFDRSLALSIAEFEFPAYFNFFIRKQQVNLIIMPDLEERIKAIFTETLLGPASKDLRLEEDFDASMPPDAYPDFREEGIFLDQNRRTLTVTTLLTFTLFDPDKMEVDLPGGVKLKYDLFSQAFVVYENRKEIASIDSRMRPPERPETRSLVREPFDIPVFGVTMLGTSHGFDKDGTTTGFVLWVNRRGLMVDPPPLSSTALEELGIPARFIEGVILTHCHADHDAGTFQKILQERSVRMLTTRTIFDSFIRKYGAISGFDAEFLKTLVSYSQVKIGKSEEFCGAALNFFYSFHVIPTVGFEARYKNDGIIYSADTNSTPSLIKRMYDKGAAGKTRRDMLMNTPLSGDHTLILHEAGVPPIHTPMAILEALPAEVTSRMYVVHSNGIPKNPNLKMAQEWDTFNIKVGEADGQSELARLVDSMEVFAGLDLASGDANATAACDLLRDCARERFDEGTTILSKGDQCEYLYFITAGVAVESGESWQKRYVVGDVFGTISLLLDGAGKEVDLEEGAVVNFPVVASTELHVFKLSAAQFFRTLEGSDVVAKVAREEAMKVKDSWPVLSSNLLFKKFSNEQIGAVQSVLNERGTFPPGDYVWVPNSPAVEALLVLEGKMEFVLDSSNAEEDGENLSTFRGNHNAMAFISMVVGRSTFIADINALMKDHPTLISLEVLESVRLLSVSKSDLIQFFQSYPGILVHLLDVHLITVDTIM